MARMTQEQKLLIVQQAAELEAVERAKFMESLPKRIFEAYALARELCVSCSVELTANGPLVRFDNTSEDDSIYLDCELSYQSNEWSLLEVEDKLDEERRRQDKIKADKITAQAAWDTLSKDQQRCVKENIVWMKHK